MIITLNDVAAIRQKHQNSKLVLTSGTFDLLHVGHLNYLQQVKQHGDILVVLLSGDKRVKARKGEKRPIIPEQQRAQMLDALSVVDYVLIDPSELPPTATDPMHAELLKRLHPDFYVTDGPDLRFYNLMDKEQFIILERLQLEPSTTSIIHKITALQTSQE